MITKEAIDNKSCLFCASDYHLEMLLLPYIVEKMNNSKFVIITQNDLENTVEKVLSRINISEELKQQIIDINWKQKGENELKKILKNKENYTIIINGEYEFISQINEVIQNYKDNNDNKIHIIDCFHVGDTSVDIEKESRNYKFILNTSKM